MFRILVCTVITLVSVSPTLVAKDFGVLRDVDLPGPGEFDDRDYVLKFADPAQIAFELREYSLEGELLYTYEHETMESALDQKDFLETRMMLLYEIVEVELPQTWIFFGRYDTYADATRDSGILRRLGFDTVIQSVIRFSNPKRR